MDLLVSENESSSSEVLSRSTREGDDSRNSLGSSRRGAAYENSVRQEEEQLPLSSDDESDQGGDERDEYDDGNEVAKGAYTGRAKDIKNEMVKSKITTSASVVLTRLPPASSDVIKKITQETNQKSKYCCSVCIRFANLTLITSHDTVSTNRSCTTFKSNCFQNLRYTTILHIDQVH